MRISYPTSGSAGTIWRPLITRHGTNGLNLNWVGANPEQGQVQLAAGTLDVAFYGAIGLAQTVSHGGDLVLFGPALNNHGRWIVRGDSSFRSPRDLVGKRIATQGESSETFLQARMASLTHGLDLKRDFQIVFGPLAANVALFERGDVDAVIGLEPTATRLVGRGARQIASGRRHLARGHRRRHATVPGRIRGETRVGRRQSQSRGGHRRSVPRRL